MKKILTLITSLFLLATLPIGAQETQPIGTEVITLSHNGQESTFKYDEMSKVMEQAVDGDTVYFSTGYFQGNFQLNKRLTFIGSGADDSNNNGNRWSNCTCYDGKINIALPEGTKLTTRLFDGIYFYDGNNSSITFSNSIENVIFRKCYWSNSWNVNAEIKSLLIDRCNCYFYLYNNSYYKKVVIRNSNIRGDFRSQDPNTLLFYHCNVYPNYGWNTDRGNAYCSGFQGTFTNCIIENQCSYWDNSTQKSIYYAATFSNPESTQESYPILINCIYYSEDGKDVTANCTLQNSTGYPVSSEKRLENMSKAELEAAGYMGNNGTVVGYYGGKNPYTLKPNIPEIASSKIHLNRDAQQLQINIKISAQQ